MRENEGSHDRDTRGENREKDNGGRTEEVVTREQKRMEEVEGTKENRGRK